LDYAALINIINPLKIISFTSEGIK